MLRYPMPPPPYGPPGLGSGTHPARRLVRHGQSYGAATQSLCSRKELSIREGKGGGGVSLLSSKGGTSFCRRCQSLGFCLSVVGDIETPTVMYVRCCPRGRCGETMGEIGKGTRRKAASPSWPEGHARPPADAFRDAVAEADMQKQGSISSLGPRALRCRRCSPSIQVSGFHHVPSSASTPRAQHIRRRFDRAMPSGDSPRPGARRRLILPSLLLGSLLPRGSHQRR